MKKQVKVISMCIIAILSVAFFGELNAQGSLASPSNWLYPDGNAQATRLNKIKSVQQDINDFEVKWVSDTIAGDLKPLIGNVIFNEQMLPGFPYAPNELTAVIGGKIYVVDATGKTHKPAKMPPFAKDITILFDTLQTFVNSNVSNAVCLGIETIESENLSDSLAFAYIASFDESADTVAILKRLALNLRDYDPNIFGSIKPVFGKRIAGMNQIYATINMSEPFVSDPQPVLPTFFRGVTQFNSDELKSFYPLNDIGDDFDSRQWLGYEVNFSQPSISLVNGSQRMLLPSYPDPDLDVLITNPTNLSQSYAARPYIMSVSLDNPSMAEDIPPVDLSNILLDDDSRPQIRPYYVDIKDAETGDSTFILVAEEYRGVEGSNGTAKLHLLESDGTPITLPLEKLGGTGLSPSYQGNTDHLWSIGVGNADGNSENRLGVFYPNNPGNEIIATQSTREFVVPNNRLMIMRYFSGNPVPKKSPPDTELNPFDTICTFRINGWLAAVNDIDGADNNRCEIFIAEGSQLLVLRMRNYTTFEFRDGHYFDTVSVFNFDKETIQNVAVVDMEGDGKNDIVVTTNDRTYLIGIKIPDKILVLYPKIQQDPLEQFCVGDSLEITWRNVYFKDPEVREDTTMLVDIFFRPYISGVPQDTLITIATDYLNNSDTISFNYIIDDLVFGYEGRFIIENTEERGVILDSSSIISFVYPEISIDQLSRLTYYANERLTMTGTISCMDTVTLEYSYDGNEWFQIDLQAVNSDYTYFLRGDLPCSMFYDCLLPDQDSIIKVAVVGHKGTYSDTSQILDIWLLPEIFPFWMEPCTTACPTRKIHWDISDMKYMCDSVVISIADISSGTYSLVEKVSVMDEHYDWNLPTNIPEWLKLRICCENSCVRKDTILHDIRPSYIGIVAPNPFKPTFEEVSINYRVPSETYVTLRIYDQANRLVADIVRSEMRRPDIIYCDKWDGKIWDGSYAANGLYYISLELSNGEKEIFPVYVKK